MENQNTPDYNTQSIQIKTNNNEPLSVGQWIGTLLLLCIPVARLILLFVWAFDADTNISKKNFARACLILYAIGIGILMILLVIIFIFSFSVASSLNNITIFM